MIGVEVRRKSASVAAEREHSFGESELVVLVVVVTFVLHSASVAVRVDCEARTEILADFATWG